MNHMKPLPPVLMTQHLIQLYVGILMIASVFLKIHLAFWWVAAVLLLLSSLWILRTFLKPGSLSSKESAQQEKSAPSRKSLGIYLFANCGCLFYAGVMLYKNILF